MPATKPSMIVRAVNGCDTRSPDVARVSAIVFASSVAIHGDRGIAVGRNG
jgi:hypothetical protein